MLDRTSDDAAIPPYPTEWPTVILAIVIHGGFLALTWWWQSLPTIVVVIVGGWLIAWHGSLQHEVIHGHPTGRRWVNDLIGSVPLSLWLPYPIYRESHLEHHRDEYLTDPIEHPESSYVTRAAWERLGPAGRLLARWNTTLFGRLTIGPAVKLLSFLGQEWRLVRANEPGRRRVWAVHSIGVALVLFWVTVISGMPLWLYLFAFVYIGAAMTRLRSYAEHRYAESHEERTAIVENSHLFGLLFLYNNLHVLHHRRPGISWYRLSTVYRHNREMLVRSNGELVYDGYWDVARRFFLKPHDDPTHPRHS
ncbi:fatty acid desaturase [Rhizobium sp. N122]|uniref:fatty acid desaturase n=1 Tax=Rhizobium sp. N122 TaxID=1764272 RepID=UPI000B5A30B6|nr:fatty acid desaturase [Rhizobium sp. N122]OWV78542.1 fatty acid desaturase [Rhizobium sp. N122]